MPGQQIAPSQNSHASALRPAASQDRAPSQSTPSRPSSSNNGALQPQITREGEAIQPNGPIPAGHIHDAAAQLSLEGVGSDQDVFSAMTTISNAAGPATPAQGRQGRDTERHAASLAVGNGNGPSPPPINQSSIAGPDIHAQELADSLKLIEEAIASSGGSRGPDTLIDDGGSEDTSMPRGSAEADSVRYAEASARVFAQLEAAHGPGFVASLRGYLAEAEQSSKESTADGQETSSRECERAKEADALPMSATDEEESAADCLLCCEPLEVRHRLDKGLST